MRYKMKNLKIQSKMLAGFGLVMATLLCLGFYTRTHLKQIDLTAHKISNDGLRGADLMSQYRTLTQDRKLLLVKHLFSTNPAEMSRLEAEDRITLSKFGKLFTDYQQTIQEPKDRELFLTLQNVRVVFLESSLELLDRKSVV